MENTKTNQQEIPNEKEISLEKKPRIKKIILISAIIAAVLAVTSIIVCILVCFHSWTEATCTAPITCTKCGATQGEPLNEDDFMKSLVSGLEARWEYNDADEGKTTLTKDDWARYFDAEYNAISKYEFAVFDNKELEKLARQYVNCIIQSKECLPYVNTNQWESKYTNGIYQDRVELLYKINSIAPIPTSNTASLKKLLTSGEVTHMVRNLLKTVKFENVSSEYGWKKYEAIVENSTTVNFSYFAFHVDLIDANGVTLTTALASVDNWKSGEKTKFSFDTSEEFETMTIEYASWNY